MKSAEEFITFAKSLKGDEKGETQTFLNHFFQIFGYEDVVTAGGTFESRIKFSDDTTKFADCLFAPIGHPGVLIEMKKRAEKAMTSPGLPSIIKDASKFISDDCVRII